MNLSLYQEQGLHVICERSRPWALLPAAEQQHVVSSPSAIAGRYHVQEGDEVLADSRRQLFWEAKVQQHQLRLRPDLLQGLVLSRHSVGLQHHHTRVNSHNNRTESKNKGRRDFHKTRNRTRAGTTTEREHGQHNQMCWKPKKQPNSTRKVKLPSLSLHQKPNLSKLCRDDHDRLDAEIAEEQPPDGGATVLDKQVPPRTDTSQHGATTQ